MYKHWPDFLLKEIALVEQRELLDIVADKPGAPPPLIDSDDLLENPSNGAASLRIYAPVSVNLYIEAYEWWLTNKPERD